MEHNLKHNHKYKHFSEKVNSTTKKKKKIILI